MYCFTKHGFCPNFSNCTAYISIGPDVCSNTYSRKILGHVKIRSVKQKKKISKKHRRKKKPNAAIYDYIIHSSQFFGGFFLLTNKLTKSYVFRSINKRKRFVCLDLFSATSKLTWGEKMLNKPN